MRLVLVFFFTIYLMSCTSPVTGPNLVKTPKCDSGHMVSCRYPIEVSTGFPKAWNPAFGFHVWADTLNQEFDDHVLNTLVPLPTYRLNFFSLAHKNDSIKERLETKNWLLQKYSESKGKMILWLINNSRDTVHLPSNTSEVTGLFEAQDESSEWWPIEYSLERLCGFGSAPVDLEPGRAIPVILDKKFTGSFATLVRFKLLADDRHYFSNVFQAPIDYCQFFRWTSPERADWALDQILYLRLPKNAYR